MSKENLRMQMLAGVITESQYKTKLKKFTILENKFKTAVSRLILNESEEDFSSNWSQLGDGFEFNGEEYETPQGFIFTYNSKNDTLESEIQYSDWGSNRDEAEAAIDPLLDELENVLKSNTAAQNTFNDVEYKILATSYAYIVTISFK